MAVGVVEATAAVRALPSLEELQMVAHAHGARLRADVYYRPDPGGGCTCCAVGLLLLREGLIAAYQAAGMAHAKDVLCLCRGYARGQVYALEYGFMGTLLGYWEAPGPDESGAWAQASRLGHDLAAWVLATGRVA